MRVFFPREGGPRILRLILAVLTVRVVWFWGPIHRYRAVGGLPQGHN